MKHKLLKSLGPEPLSDAFDGEYLWAKSRGRKVSIKQFIMNAQVVVGVGNIYASEALFLACINPRRAAGRVSLRRYELLASGHQERPGQRRLQGWRHDAAETFYGGDGEAGYFQQQLEAYGRNGRTLSTMQYADNSHRAGSADSTYYCKQCQT